MSGEKRQSPSGGDSADIKTIKKRKHDNNGGSKDMKYSKNFTHHQKANQTVIRDANGSASSKEAHAKQKALAKERKAAKPNADPILRAKKLWERLRLKSHVQVDERKKLVEELFSIVSGNIKDFVFKHDSVRTVQCAIKYANKAQTKMIAKELKGEYKTLAESRYAKFLVAKLLVSGDQEINEMIISEFYGHVRRLINHPEASWILDDTYRQVATPRQKAMLLREWYGPEFAIFKTAQKENPQAELAAILEENPEKRKPIMTYLYALINQLIQKKMSGFTMLHDAMLQYSLAVGSPTSSEAAAEFIELLKDDDDGDLLKNLAFTKSGSRIISRALALSTAKDRKLILRAFKDHIPDLSHDPNGSTILLTAFETVDDTVMTSKTIISDLLASKSATPEARYDALVEQANHPAARIPLLYLFATDNAKRLIGADSHAMHVLDEVRTLRAETSKKDPETRRAELARALSQDGVLLAAIEARAQRLVETSFGCQFVTEVVLGAEGDKAAAMAAVADLAAGDPAADGHIAQSGHAGRMLKTLVTGGRWDGAKKEVVKIEPRLGFAELLYTKIKAQLPAWATGASSFVVVNFMEDEGFEEKGDVVKRLKNHKAELKKASEEGNKGAGILLASM